MMTKAEDKAAASRNTFWLPIILATIVGLASVTGSALTVFGQWQAAREVETVKTTLATATSSTEQKLKGIADVADKTHVLVNSNMEIQLRLNADNARFKANTTKDPSDIAAADLAEKMLKEHMLKQQAVDAEHTAERK